MNTFTKKYLDESIELIRKLDAASHRGRRRRASPRVRDGGGRLFILGVGGSAGHASHAVNDFRKICGFEAYAPTDNVSELTARVNDEGWDTCFSEWLKGSRLRAGDGLLVFSRRRRQPREERERQPRAVARARAGSRRQGVRHRRARRRLHEAGRPTPASSSRRSPAERDHAAHRGLLRPSCGTCSSATRELQRSADEVGEREVTRRRDPRSRRHHHRRRPGRGDGRDLRRLPSRPAAPPRRAPSRGCAPSRTRGSCSRSRPTSRRPRRGSSRPTRCADERRAGRAARRPTASRIAAVEVCMHHPEGGPGGDPALVRRCDCRKPKPGMLDGAPGAPRRPTRRHRG